MLKVEVACALPDRQAVVELQVPQGCTAREAVAASDLDTRFPELDLPAAPLAVYGQPVADDYRVQAGDRVEVLRPLQRDPRDARRELAARGETVASPGRRAGD